jgi:hypothetical protein
MGHQILNDSFLATFTVHDIYLLCGSVKLAGNHIFRTFDDMSVIFLVIATILQAKETKMGFALWIPALNC